ncbi:MAG: hypothetical protein C1O27_002131 [Chloroflexi bacterium]|jgi:ABC-2 type transport system permease protein|nr:MAG: hypothetical protein C1O27_002131 [Chloroflexota bacterium]
MAELRGEVFDLGYQRYEGPREGRWRTRYAIFENGLRSMLGIGRGGRSKVLPILLVLAAIAPAAVFVIIVSVIGDDDFIPGPSDYYQIVSLVLFLFSAIMAPELLIPDRRDRVLDLYLVRPLTVTDYLVARVAAFFVIALALVYSGQIVLQIGLILTAASPVDFIQENWLDIPRFILSGALIAFFVTIIPVTVAGFMSRRAIATAFVIGLWLIATLFVGALTSGECYEESTTASGGRIQETTACEPIKGEAAKWVALLDLGNVPMHLNEMIFGEEPDQSDNPTLYEVAKLPAIVPILWYALWIVGPASLLWFRYRKVKI